MKRLTILLTAIVLVSCTSGGESVITTEDGVELSSIQCRDGDDNDGDGDVDCDDPDCRDFVFCQEDTVDTTDTSSAAGSSWVGAACEADLACQNISGDGNAFCHPVFGTCTRGCEPANPGAPTVGGCGMNGVVCAASIYNVPGGHENICALPCTPESNSNPCPDGLTCHPEWGFSVEAMTSTCQFPACLVDADCADFGLYAKGESCLDDRDCLFGGQCEPTQFICNYELDCDALTGRCIFNNPDKSDVEIGDPCNSQLDCGSGMACNLPDEYTAQEDQLWKNGYCTKFGCLATVPNLPGGTTDFIGKNEFHCGDEGTCYVNPDVGGMCLRTCNPTVSSGHGACRQPVWNGGTVLDAPGDYECYTNFLEPYAITYIEGAAGTPSATGPNFLNYASDPVCMPPNFVYSCNDLAAIDPDLLNCSDSFGDGDNDMQCRDLTTGQPVASGGWCADSTTSGPAGDWITQPASDTDTDTDTI